MKISIILYQVLLYFTWLFWGTMCVFLDSFAFSIYFGFEIFIPLALVLFSLVLIAIIGSAAYIIYQTYQANRSMKKHLKELYETPVIESPDFKVGLLPDYNNILFPVETINLKTFN